MRKGMRVNPEPRPRILEIEPYVGGKANIDGKDNIIKLSSNESANGPSPLAVEAYMSHANLIGRYPDGGAEDLRTALGSLHKIDADQIVCGAGSDEILQLICKAYSGPGDEVLFTEHSFLVYRLAALAAGATPVAVPEVNLQADVDQILNAVSENTKIVFIANPNNPTGSYLSSTKLDILWRGLPENVLLVIDGAYAEFVGSKDYDAGKNLVSKARNVVMTRTFSKIYALASLRIGWCYAPQSIVDVINRVRGPFNVSGAALNTALAALSDLEHISKAISINKKWLDKLPLALEGTRLKCFPSVGNFILIQFPEEVGINSKSADKYLRQNGIIVRNVDSYGLPNCLRVTLGLDHEMDIFIDLLKTFMGNYE